MSDFKGKWILVTGAAGDIGKAVAKRFSALGAGILITDINDEKLEISKSEIAESGADVRSFIADVTNVQSVESLVGSIESAGLSIDFLFNNAGYQGEFQMTQNYPPDDFKRVIEVNLIGAFNVLSVVSRHMVSRKTGAIVNTASMAGVDGPPNMIAYGASKAAIIAMTQSAAKDLAPFGIRVNAISPAFMGPGFMWTRQVELQAKVGSQYFDSDPEKVAAQMIGSVPMRRYGNINEIPGTVEYLMSEASSYITGVNIPISGGIR